MYVDPAQPLTAAGEELDELLYVDHLQFEMCHVVASRRFGDENRALLLRSTRISGDWRTDGLIIFTERFKRLDRLLPKVNTPGGVLVIRVRSDAWGEGVGQAPSPTM